MPAHDRVRLDNDRSVQQRRHKTIEPDKEQSVCWREPWLGGNPAPQQVHLMAQEDNLGLQPRLRLEGEANTCSNRPRNETILRHYPISWAATVWIGFSAGTAISEEAQRGLVQPRRDAICRRPDLPITNDGAVECRLLCPAAVVNPCSDAARWRLVLYPAPDFGLVKTFQDDF
jgi:hypothetical protein